MTHPTISIPHTTIGIDVSDRFSHVCVLDQAGEAVYETRIRTAPDALGKFLKSYAGALVAYEVGSHSPWMTHVVRSLGLDPLVANARKLSYISRNDKKNDRADAETLARLARVDPKLLCPIRHRSMQTQGHRVLLRAREGLVRARTRLINGARGLVKPFGTRLPRCSAPSFHKRVLDEIPEYLRAALIPMLEVVAHLTKKIYEYDREIKRVCNDCYPETERLRQVRGVGEITALAFVLCIEDPSRFDRSRDVGPFVGLVPKQYDSGDSTPQLRITKAGDEQLRRLLVGCAHYILGPFGEDCDLRRYGQMLAERGGQNARKRAAVAVARKLAVLLHRLWVSGKEYQPLRRNLRKTA